MEEINNEQIKETISTYIEGLKNNVNFLVGIGGFISFLSIFHYSVFKAREAEFLGINTDQINENIIVEGVRQSLDFIILLVGVIGILMVATYLVRKNLFNNEVKMYDKPFMGKWGIKIVVGLLITCMLLIGAIGYLMNFHLTLGQQDIIGSFSLLIIFIELQICITTYNFWRTTKNFETHSEMDFQVIVQLVYIAIMILFFLLPFIFFNIQVMKQDSIVLTKNHSYLLVEKSEDKVVLRKIDNEGNGTQYLLTNEYKTRDAKKFTFIEIKIDKISHEEGKIRLNIKH